MTAFLAATPAPCEAAGASLLVTEFLYLFAACDPLDGTPRDRRGTGSRRVAIWTVMNTRHEGRVVALGRHVDRQPEELHLPCGPL